jgi:hypothetical protein
VFGNIFEAMFDKFIFSFVLLATNYLNSVSNAILGAGFEGKLQQHDVSGGKSSSPG